MQILTEVADILSALLADRPPDDPTFQRMARVYREVTALLGCQAEYELLLRGLLAGHPGAGTASGQGALVSNKGDEARE